MQLSNQHEWTPMGSDQPQQVLSWHKGKVPQPMGFGVHELVQGCCSHKSSVFGLQLLDEWSSGVGNGIGCLWWANAKDVNANKNSKAAGMHI